MTASTEGARAGGIKDGAFWGHLNYIDHGTGMHLKDTAVTGYTCDSSDPNCLNHCRIICHDVTNNGVPGYTARVRVCDNGEPGGNDTFEIKLYSTPPPPPCGQGSDTPIYVASGDLGGGQPGGGNIQLHQCQWASGDKAQGVPLHRIRFAGVSRLSLRLVELLIVPLEANDPTARRDGAGNIARELPQPAADIQHRLPGAKRNAFRKFELAALKQHRPAGRRCGLQARRAGRC